MAIVLQIDTFDLSGTRMIQRNTAGDSCYNLHILFYKYYADLSQYGTYNYTFNFFLKNEHHKN